MVEKIVFEPLVDSHREAVIRIFNHYVMNGTAAFSDAELPESFYPHILERVKGYPAYAVVDCRTGEVVGFCFLSAYKPVPTFRETATVTYPSWPGHWPDVPGPSGRGCREAGHPPHHCGNIL